MRINTKALWQEGSSLKSCDTKVRDKWISQKRFHKKDAKKQVGSWLATPISLPPLSLHGADLLDLTGRVVGSSPSRTLGKQAEGTESQELSLHWEGQLWSTGGQGTRGRRAGGREEMQTGAPWQLWGPGTGRAAHGFLRSPYAQGDQARQMRRKERKTVTFHHSWTETESALDAAFVARSDRRGEKWSQVSSTWAKGIARVRDNPQLWLHQSFQSELTRWVRLHALSSG